VLLAAWSNLLFRRAHTSLAPIKPTTALVLTGPYQLTRNPMYLGLLCVYIAAALWFGVIWALVLVPLVLCLRSAGFYAMLILAIGYAPAEWVALSACLADSTVTRITLHSA
jgi:protein-S-isoprenylcysteine O-methyltransferase Ste14